LELGEDADVLIVIARNKTAASEMQTDHHISLVRRPDHVCPSPCPVSKQIGACAPHTRLLHIRMSHAIIQETSRQLGRRYAPDLVQPALCRTDRSLSALGNSLAESVEDGTPLSSLELETYARAFAGFVVSRYLKDGAGPKATGGLSKASLRKVLHLAESRFEQEVSLLDLASEAGLSVSHFCREFKRAMSITPMQHLMHVRCKEAMRRLEDPGQTLTRIAMDCGFGNSQTFSRSFRKIVGMLPSEYRAMQLRTV
jgi:AraC family transcriptional regulator